LITIPVSVDEPLKRFLFLDDTTNSSNFNIYQNLWGALKENSTYVFKSYDHSENLLQNISTAMMVSYSLNSYQFEFFKSSANMLKSRSFDRSSSKSEQCDQSNLTATASGSGTDTSTPKSDSKKKIPARIVWPDSCRREEVLAMSRAHTLMRDLVNTPAWDMGPAQLEKVAFEIGLK
jgi:leucyl aminopeptidase